MSHGKDADNLWFATISPRKLHVRVETLPGKKLTFLIVPEDTSNVKELKFSRASIGLMACFMLCVLAGVAFMLQDYVRLKGNTPSKSALLEEVQSQRAQIQIFANKINALNEELAALRDLEKKIRVIANVKEPAEEDAVFGVGGTMPHDLDTLRPLAERHNSLIRDMHAGADYLDQAFAVEKQGFEELHGYLRKQRSLLASTPSIRPTAGWIASGFGNRVSPFTGLEEFHRGLDIATRDGTPIVAPADGMVTFAGNNGSLGKTVVIDHGNGMVTRYGHMKEWLAECGAHVKRGDKIGSVGNTGRSTGPHLHYEVHLNGIPVNPADYILN